MGPPPTGAQTSSAVNSDGQITRCAERAATGSRRGIHERHGGEVARPVSNARSWIVTTPGHGRTSGRKQLCACTAAAPEPAQRQRELYLLEQDLGARAA